MSPSDHELALTQMRASIQKSSSSAAVKYGDPTLKRFLVARSMDPKKAAKMLVEWERWRAEFVPLGCIPEEEIPQQLEARKIFLQGPAMRGQHPLVIVHMRKHFIPKDQLQFKKLVVHSLDKAIASAAREREVGSVKIVGLLDVQNISYRNIDTRGLIIGFQFLQVVIVNGEEAKKVLIEEIGEDVLPEEYGGRAKLTALQDVTLDNLSLEE